MMLLDRKEKVDELKNKSGNKSNMSISTIDKIKSSPTRKNCET